ncbi:endonuclease V [Streptomyces thermolineatus]|uniref:Endonuclease V n=1 Tax=Streptomyces thermolineatus TaxID=44033 RepID=A0ABN3MHL5_9ACTN
MHFELPHDWPATEAEAIALQVSLAPMVDRTGPGPQEPRLIAGLDVAYAGDGRDGTPTTAGSPPLPPSPSPSLPPSPAAPMASAAPTAPGRVRVAAGIAVLDARSLEVVETATAVGFTAFPYVSGLFAFRELPVLLDALRALRTVPDLLLCDGQGVAHPRRFGLACHLGVITGLPTAGVAKTPFTGSSVLPADERGAWTPMLDGDEVVGRTLRTRAGVKPVHVSVGHRIDLDTACRHVLAAAPRYRLPETTRIADRLSRDALASAIP